MRQIKFRGKRLDNGEWLHGSLIRRIDRTEIFDDVFTWEVDPAFGQPYRDFENKVNPTREQRRLARWCNHKATFKSCDFEDYKL